MYKKPSESELKKVLTPEQYQCTQEEGTEPPFQNKYWNHKEDGLYVDVVSGEPLFLSLDKFDSGSGWPSFTQPLHPHALNSKEDHKLFVPRTEVRSAIADSHLGHVFDDGPGPTGLRFCINSAAMNFIPFKEMNVGPYKHFMFAFAKKLNLEIATLAGGCFWGMEDLIRKIPGIITTSVGYAGGKAETANYQQVKTGNTGHAEAVHILFNPQQLQYSDILIEFFKMHNPTTKNQQGNDIGSQYRSEVFFHSAEQRKAAEAIIVRINKSNAWGGPAVTILTPFENFFVAEDYHQDYLIKHPDGYTCHFRRDLKF